MEYDALVDNLDRRQCGDHTPEDVHEAYGPPSFEFGKGASAYATAERDRPLVLFYFSEYARTSKEPQSLLAFRVAAQPFPAGLVHCQEAQIPSPDDLAN